MSEPVEGGDETLAQDLGETAAAPQATPTEAVAWSGNDDAETTTVAVRESWLSTWRRAGVLVAAGLVLAAAIVLASWIFADNDPSSGNASQTASTSAAQPPAAVPAPKRGGSTTSSAAPPSIASTPDQDNKYVQALNDRGISFANPDAAIYNGKMVCTDLGRGVTVQQIADAFRASNPALSGSANAYVAISVHSYCPQNNALVAGF